MISKIKKNRINLFKLKKLKEMIFIENKFDIFLKKNFFLNSKKKNQFLFKNRSCVCGVSFKKKNKNVFIKPFKYIKCDACNTVSIDPMINDAGLNIIYSQNGIYSLYRKNFVEKKSKKFLRENIINQRKVDQVLSLFNTKKFSLVDFGCGNGGFLSLLKKSGIKKLIGIDKRFESNCSENDIFFSNSLDAYKKKFDCITMWGVLEHVNNPLAFLKYIVKFLKKNGFLVMEFPSSDSLLMSYIMQHKYDAPRYLEKGRHLYFFGKKFIEILEKKINLKIYDIESNGLDIQTIIGEKVGVKEKEIFSIQENLDNNLMSDHYRIALKKM